MQLLNAEIRLLKRPHKFFVYWFGQPNEHIMDWTGCNYHRVKAEGQPKDGFDTPWDAWLWAETRVAFTEQAIRDEIYDKNGSFISDNAPADADDTCDICWAPDAKEPQFSIHCTLYCDAHDRVYYDPPKEWLQKYHDFVKSREEYQRRDTAKKMWNAGRSYRDIANSMSVSVAEVRRLLKKQRTILVQA